MKLTLAIIAITGWLMFGFQAGYIQIGDKYRAPETIVYPWGE